MDEQSTNGALDGWLSKPVDDGPPVATITAPPVQPQPTIPPPPPPPAPAQPPLQPAAPVTSAGPHTQPQPPVEPSPQGWSSHPPESPPLADRKPAQKPARQPRMDVERAPVEGEPSTLRDRFKAQRPFYRAVVLIIVAVFLFIAGSAVLNRWGSVTGAAVASHIPAQAPAVAAPPQQITQTVVVPTDWLKCPLTVDASGLIGWDAKTNYKTVDPQRAANIMDQVAEKIGFHSLSELWLHSEGPTSLKVTIGGPLGVPLVDCTLANVPAQQPGQPTASTAPTATSAPR